MNAKKYDAPIHYGLFAVCAVALLATGCQGRRLFTPMASKSMDTSPPQMHGPSTLSPSMDEETHVHQDASGQIRVTSEAAVPETSIAPVEQRLATVKAPKPPVQQSVAIEEVTPNDSKGTSSNSIQPIDATQPDQAVARTIRPTNYASDTPTFEVPAEYGGVDVSGLMKALQDAPPEIQKAAIGRLIAMSRKRAQPSPQPLAIEDALEASFDSLPELPEEVVDRGLNPTPLAAGKNKSVNQTQHAAQRAESTTERPTSPEPQPANSQVATMSNSGDPAVQQIAATEISFSDQPSQLQTVSAEAKSTSAAAKQMTMPLPSETQASTELNSTQPITSPVPAEIHQLSDTELFDALVQRLQTPTDNETEAERHRRVVMARHLLVLSGDPDRAVEKIDGLSNEEEEFLRHQLLGLWTIIDPNGHPVPSRRLSSALPEIRKATGFLAAASDTLEIRGTEFCTEIEAYGEVTPFASRRFVPGQEVILYCEVENFKAAALENGFETRLQGSYDLIDADGRRVSSQTLPEDRQVSKNWLRDYFVAYQMYLPDAIDPGRYQLRLTMEDLHGRKYGQSTLDFEIKP